MYKYGKNFKPAKKVRINDYDDQTIDDFVRIPVKILKNSEVKQPERPKRYMNNDYSKSRTHDRESSEEREMRHSQRQRSRRGRSCFNPLLGDNFVDRKLTRTFVYYRPPFDWYHADRGEILDEYEEILMPERSAYSRQNSDDSIYDRLERYDQDQGRQRNRSKNEPIYDSGSDRKKTNGVRTKEIVTEREYEIEEEENLFSFEDRDSRKPKMRNERLKKNKHDNLNEVVENFNDFTIDERKRYRKSNKRY